ncbi:MAG TPA: hypothetical protein VHX36_04120 [Candidatus Acidoferrales bacterium]|nr:hypothetical protein [Candidatus Acidoferrales bacterium]
MALLALWGGLFWATWATWGSLTIDSGREMYVPMALLRGKMLYRDVFYLYGPLSPYFNSLLYRLFGVHLAVLYWAGALSALFSGVFLFFTGLELGSWPAGLGAASIVQIQAFESSYMCFPLPYSFASVYGCLTACVFIWLVVRSCKSPGRIWIFGVGCAAAVAFLLKLEFGFACYTTLGILLVLRGARQGWKSFLRDCVAVLPGVAVCLLVTAWMVSIDGVRFITQENIMSWPTSYFMRRYGKQWLAITGCTITTKVVAEAALWTVALVAVALLANRIFRRIKSDRSRFFVWAPIAILSAGCGVWFLPWRVSVVAGLRRILFPKQMVCLIVVAAGFLLLRAWRERPKEFAFPMPLVFIFSSLLALRLLFGIGPWGYSIYYDGPAALCFLLLGDFVIPRSGRTQVFVTRSQSLVAFSVVAVVSLYASILSYDLANRVALVTDVGTIKVSEPMAESYRAALDWMKDVKARGQTVLSIPEDTSLYFLSGMDCPIRMLEFTPGLVAPGSMTEEQIAEISASKVSYLLWSNREFPEYGTPVFGTDYDRQLGDYLKSRYQPVRPLTNQKPSQWNAVIWARIPDVKTQ